jgi:hypothetical protein
VNPWDLEQDPEDIRRLEEERRKAEEAAARAQRAEAKGRCGVCLHECVCRVKLGRLTGWWVGAGENVYVCMCVHAGEWVMYCYVLCT